MTAKTLLLNVQPLAPDTRVSDVLDVFNRDRDRIALPIVTDTRPVGIVNRKTLIEHFAKPFARELSGRKSISEFMDSNPLIVEADTDLDDLSRRIVDTGMQGMYDGFIITCNGAYAGMGTSHDLMKVQTERKQAHLYRLAHSDSLTGLPNRLLFEDRLTQALKQAQRTQQPFAIFYLDLDRFKIVNDTFGHTAGDTLLQAVAERLGASVRESDTVARMGGDEFTLILTDIGTPQNAAHVAQVVLESLRKPFILQGYEICISASIGIALFPVDKGENSVETMLKNADSAMYKAKANGKNNYQFFTPEMNVSTLKRLVLENDMRKALDNGDFLLHYQPRVDCTTGVATGMEALIRWRHATSGLISPAEFIPLAEETGLIIPMGEWVLRTACAQTKGWMDRGMPPLRVSINLSARQFKHAGLIAMIEDVLSDTGLPPEYLELELTEGLAMENVTETITTLRIMKAMGMSIAIDDFGTGYSSLSYLKRFPIDYLKIDQSFVRDVTNNADGAAIARTIIDMGHNLQLHVVAEGVETQEQLDFIRQHGCEEAQGYLFSRPLPSEEFAAFITSKAQLVA